MVLWSNTSELSVSVSDQIKWVLLAGYSKCIFIFSIKDSAMQGLKFHSSVRSLLSILNAGHWYLAFAGIL